MMFERARRTVRGAAAAAASTALVTLAACGSSPGTGPAAAAPGSATAYPTQDVVSSVTVDPKARAELPAAVRTSGRLTLGTPLTPGTAGLPHSGQAPGGARIGLDVDLRNAVAKRLGVAWSIQNGTFATIIPGVQNGKYDVGQGNFGVTKSREKVVDFATYLSDGQAFLAAKDVPLTRVGSLTDLCGLTVATSPGSTFQQILTAGAGTCAAAGKKPYQVKYFADTGPILLGLGNGKIDIFFGPTLSLKYDATHVPNTKFLSQISSTPVGFVTANGSPLAKALSDATNSLIHDGTYAKIFTKWSVPDSAIKKSEVNPAATL
jgi:polar amino acid transport system substrate-binding protein